MGSTRHIGNGDDDDDGGGDNNKRHCLQSEAVANSLSFVPFYKLFKILGKPRVIIASPSDEIKNLTLPRLFAKLYITFLSATWAFELQTRGQTQRSESTKASVCISPIALFPNYIELIHRYLRHTFLSSVFLLG